MDPGMKAAVRPRLFRRPVPRVAPQFRRGAKLPLLRNGVRRHPRLLLAVAFLLLAVHTLFGPHGLLAMYRAKREIRQTQQELQKLNEENRQLTQQIKALKSDPAAIERIAREDMGLARPGELIFKLPAKPNEAMSSGQPAKTKK